MNLEETKKKLKEAVGRLRPDPIDFSEKIEGLPAFNSLVATLQYRIKVTHIFYLAVLIIIFLWNINLLFINGDLREEIKKPTEAFIVPSFIPDVMRIRANSINDSQVFEYASYMASCLGNFNYEKVEQQFDDCSKYMSPQFKAKFRTKNRIRIPLWKERRVDQLFVYDRPTKFQRKTTDEEGTVFVVQIWGKVKKYMEGRELPPYWERMTLKIKTVKWSPGRPFLFETHDLTRITKEEEEDQKAHEQMKKIEEQKAKEKQ